MHLLEKLVVTDEQKKEQATTCYRCKKVFPEEKLIGRRFHRYCHRCFWIDSCQMIGVAFLVASAIALGLVFYAKHLVH
jgi:hypothetical protein